MKWAIAILLALVIAALDLNAQGDVSAKQINGTWKYRNNEFKIWSLGQQKLQIEFFGDWEHDSAVGRTANTGEGNGIARIDADTAIFKPKGAEEECKITLKFAGGKLTVRQEGICGFGFNVRADGIYKRISSAKPKFDAGEQ
ncbi:MAG TPA: hypothetical protein VH170_02445 [Chthoniobacterales bacterium]|jgi:hypothetical protein|nr:hypothetical protein [Chthoniobacterales bacterium]